MSNAVVTDRGDGLQVDGDTLALSISPEGVRRVYVSGSSLNKLIADKMFPDELAGEQYTITRPVRITVDFLD